MRYYILGCLFIGLDQLTKWSVRNWMEIGESISVLGDFFRLTYVQNSGAAFSMLSGHPLILLVFPLAAISGALWYLHHHRGEHWILYTAWTFIIAGGIGNLIDRFIFGWVTDMLDFSIFPPVFNVADIGVSVGCVLFIIYIVVGEKSKI